MRDHTGRSALALCNAQGDRSRNPPEPQHTASGESLHKTGASPGRTRDHRSQSPGDAIFRWRDWLCPGFPEIEREQAGGPPKREDAYGRAGQSEPQGCFDEQQPVRTAASAQPGEITLPPHQPATPNLTARVSDFSVKVRLLRAFFGSSAMVSQFKRSRDVNEIIPYFLTPQSGMGVRHRSSRNGTAVLGFRRSSRHAPEASRAPSEVVESPLVIALTPMGPGGPIDHVKETGGRQDKTDGQPAHTREARAARRRATC